MTNRIYFVDDSLQKHQVLADVLGDIVSAGVLELGWSEDDGPKAIIHSPCDLIDGPGSPLCPLVAAIEDPLGTLYLLDLSMPGGINHANFIRARYGLPAITNLRDELLLAGYICELWKKGSVSIEQKKLQFANKRLQLATSGGVDDQNLFQSKYGDVLTAGGENLAIPVRDGLSGNAKATMRNKVLSLVRRHDNVQIDKIACTSVKGESPFTHAWCQEDVSKEWVLSAFSEEVNAALTADDRKALFATDLSLAETRGMSKNGLLTLCKHLFKESQVYFDGDNHGFCLPRNVGIAFLFAIVVLIERSRNNGENAFAVNKVYFKKRSNIFSVTLESSCLNGGVDNAGIRESNLVRAWLSKLVINPKDESSGQKIAGSKIGPIVEGSVCEALFNACQGVCGGFTRQVTELDKACASRKFEGMKPPAFVAWPSFVDGSIVIQW